MAHQLVITTGARLHFGLLANAPQSGRRFGGVGLMIDEPGFRLGFRVAESDNVIARSETESAEANPSGAETRHVNHTANRISEFVAAFRQAVPALESRCEITLYRSVPSHIGLGSGTQLGMAVAQGLSLLAHESLVSPAELGRRVGRGKRSALGIHGFDRGGFLVEGGKSDRAIGSLITRLNFPAEWRLVLIRPRASSGLCGAEEKLAFSQLPPMSRETTDRLCGIVVMELLPAIVDGEFASSSAALHDYGRIVGDYFSPAQQGIYADPRMVELAAELRQRGVAGVGQTSWGPTLFALAPTAADAEDIVSDFAESRWGDCEWRIAAPLNSGAALEFPTCKTESAGTLA